MPETADTAKGIPKDRAWLPLLGSGLGGDAALSWSWDAGAQFRFMSTVTGRRRGWQGYRDTGFGHAVRRI